MAVQAAEAAVKAGVASGGGAALPGMIFNSKKTVSWVDAATGRARKEPAGRMECTMQVKPKIATTVISNFPFRLSEWLLPPF